MSSDLKTPTVPRITTSRLFSKKSSLKLPITFSVLISGVKASNIS